MTARTIFAIRDSRDGVQWFLTAGRKPGTYQVRYSGPPRPHRNTTLNLDHAACWCTLGRVKLFLDRPGGDILRAAVSRRSASSQVAR